MTRRPPRWWTGGTDVRSSIVSSQIDLHAEFGGVVPEIAGRAHVELLTPVVADALVEAGVDGPTSGRWRPRSVRAWSAPCSSASSAAKALALVWDVPFVGVNHLEAHLYAALLEEPDLELPLVFLLVSGGHTLLVVMEGHGRYRVARLHRGRRGRGGLRQGGPLPGPRLPGWADHRPSGAATGTRRPSPSPGPWPTRAWTSRSAGSRPRWSTTSASIPDVAAEDVAASFQEAVVDVLVAKARRGRGRGRGRRGSPSAGGWRPTPACGRRSWPPRPRTAGRATCPAGPCAPTTRPWWRPAAGTAGRPTAARPLDLGADPGLRLG